MIQIAQHTTHNTQYTIYNTHIISTSSKITTMVTTKTKKRSTWTKKEEDALIQAIQKYGVGQWRKILNDAKFGPILIKRNNVQLKDKVSVLCVFEEGYFLNLFFILVEY